MNKKILILSASLLLSMGTWAQSRGQESEIFSEATAANYELAARFSSAQLKKMIFSTQVQPIWFKNSNRFVYSYKTAEGEQVYIVDPAKGKKEPAFSRDALAMRLTEIIKDPLEGRHLKMEQINLKDDRYLTFSIESSQPRIFENDSSEIAQRKRGSKQRFFFEYDLQTGHLTDVTKTEQDKDLSFPYFAVVSPDGQKGIYVKGHDLYMMDAANLKKAALSGTDSTLVEVRLTTDGTHDFCWGTDNYKGDISKDSTERVRPSSLVWSPDSRRFATIRWDMSRIKDAWVINSLAEPRPTLETFKFQMPGEPGADGFLYLFDTERNSCQKIQTSAYKEGNIFFEYYQPKYADLDKEHLPYVMQWAGDTDGFFFTQQSRDHKQLDLCYLAVADSVAKVVVHEEMNSFIENRPIKLIHDGKQIIQWSERNGWAQLYLYEADGKLVRNLTPGAYHVEEVLGVNEKEKYVVFSACGVDAKENPYQKHTYKVSLEGGKPVLLDSPDLHVDAVLSDDARYFVANCSRVDLQPTSALYDIQTGKKVMDLEKADLSLLLKAGYRFPERFKVKAADGVTDLYGVMYKPYDFDSTKVYPIIDFVYPGPVTEANSIGWSPVAHRTDRLAQLGFIVVTVGNRGGHPNRSKWYHNYGYGNLRDYGLADQKFALEQLAYQHRYIDLDRVGVLGHSGGGFMSTTALLTYPDFFKVAVSCSGNHDNRIYSRWWSEQHHGYQQPAENQNQAYATYYRNLAQTVDASYAAYADYYEKLANETVAAVEYKVGTNQELVHNLKGHLLLVHGDMDDNVSMSHTLRVVDALVKNNKRFDMLILPGQRHWYSEVDDYFFWRMADYFCQWLKDSKRHHDVNIKELNNHQ